MFLYLVQHAEAKREEEDPARPLSHKGVEEVKRVASFISRFNIEVEEILHSGKLRAKQTAEILAEKIKTIKGPAETDGLAPLDSPVIWAERLKALTNSLMLVGHLPHLGKLASLLLSGNIEKNIVSFKMGGIVCLKRNTIEDWSLQWMIIPELVS